MGASEPSEPSYMMQTARELPTGWIYLIIRFCAVNSQNNWINCEVDLIFNCTL